MGPDCDAGEDTAGVGGGCLTGVGQLNPGSASWAEHG